MPPFYVVLLAALGLSGCSLAPQPAVAIGITLWLVAGLVVAYVIGGAARYGRSGDRNDPDS